MSKAERQVERVVAKATPEGVAVGVAISQLSLLHLLIQSGATLAIREGLRFTPPEIMVTAAAVVFVGTVVTSILYEAHVLEKLGFTANPATTLVHFKIENPLLASTIGNLYALLAFLVSPVDMGFSLSSLALGDGGLLLLSNLLARQLTGFAFYNGLNFALYHGHAERLTAKIHELRLKVAGPVQDKLDRLTAFLERSMTTAALAAEYQEGNIGYQEMLDSISAFNQEN